MRMTTYTPTIGLEIHAELKTKSKMFCGCKNDPHAGEPNTFVCPVCLAHPGTLPTVNKEAVRKLMLVGEALGGELATYSEFDRKNYFYPDIPKAYQISQYDFPFVKGGELAGVKITRVHLEEDTARSQHSGNKSVVDFNRAGVPLMELVTEPVIHDSKTAGDFAKELQLLLKTLGVSDANMEKGEMRVEANISISSTKELGTKVEVKNLNSFKSVVQAIEFEISRQNDISAKKGLVLQETRGWDENKGKTFSQRTKETADDYRYFPDPDIPKYDLSLIPEFQPDQLSAEIPTLPAELRENWLELGLKKDQVGTLLYDQPLKAFFEAVLTELEGDTDRVKLAANYLTSDVVGLLAEDTDKVLDDKHSKQFVSLVNMVKAGDINSRVAKDLLPEVVFDGKEPKELAEEKGLLQSSSAEELMPIVEQIIADNPGVVADFKAGKEAALQYLVGQAMKATRGAANPSVLAELMKQRIEG